MKKSKFTEAQIIKILRQYDAGSKVADLCREQCISQATFYNWKSKYGGIDASQLKKLKVLEEENRTLKRMYADVALQRDALKDLIEKKF